MRSRIFMFISSLHFTVSHELLFTRYSRSLFIFNNLWNRSLLARPSSTRRSHHIDTSSRISTIIFRTLGSRIESAFRSKINVYTLGERKNSSSSEGEKKRRKTWGETILDVGASRWWWRMKRWNEKNAERASGDDWWAFSPCVCCCVCRCGVFWHGRKSSYKARDVDMINKKFRVRPSPAVIINTHITESCSRQSYAIIDHRASHRARESEQARRRRNLARSTMDGWEWNAKDFSRKFQLAIVQHRRDHVIALHLIFITKPPFPSSSLAMIKTLTIRSQNYDK